MGLIVAFPPHHHLGPNLIFFLSPSAANERTFLHWMNMAVTTGSISAALLGKDTTLLNSAS